MRTKNSCETKHHGNCSMVGGYKQYPHSCFFYMCNAFHCVQSTIFLSWWSRKGKDNAEQEANYKSIKITEENSKNVNKVPVSQNVLVCVCV